MNVVVLIPAYNPDESLLSVVESLLRLDFRDIIIVDDGCKPECRPIFERLEGMEGCHVLRHAVNLGKGRALKTGFNYFYLNFPEAPGIITVDADGQHLPEDVRKVADTFLRNPRKIVLGSRRFGKGTPLRSLLGNVVTQYVFRLCVGKKVSDTQTGLRCIPTGRIPDMIRLEGERYEYEMNMLIATKTNRTEILEETISTVYLDDNKSSHFNPLIDSMKIYFLLLRFSFSSLFASFVDFVLFTTVFYLSDSILTSMITARLISVNITFFINRRLVFHDDHTNTFTVMKFYATAILLGSLSYYSVNYLHESFGTNVILTKLVTEIVLFFLSFMLQRDVVFNAQPAES